jgi:hypothetical protein
MDEPTHAKPNYGKQVSIEDAIAFIKLCMAYDNGQLVTLIHDGWMYPCEINNYVEQPYVIDMGCSCVEGEIHIRYSVEAESDTRFCGQDMEYEDMVYILETYGDGCTAVCFKIDISAMMLGNTTVFKTNNKYHYMYAEDVPVDEIEHMTEVPYKHGNSLKRHRITHPTKSANKQ